MIVSNEAQRSSKDLDTGLLTTLYTEYVSSAELESLAVDGIYPVPALFDTSASLLADGYYAEKVTVTASLWDGIRAYDARRRTVRHFSVEGGLVRWLSAAEWEQETTSEEDCGSKAGGLKRCRAGAVVSDAMIDPLRLEDGPATSGSAEHVTESTEGE